MACVHEMIKSYRPELDLEEPFSADEVVEHLAEETELDAETIRTVLEAMPDMLYFYLLRGRPVEIPGLGEVKPTIDLDGTIRGALDLDEDLVERLSEEGAYRGGINRQENIGLRLERMAQMWNSSHPDSPVRDVDAYAIVNS